MRIAFVTTEFNCNGQVFGGLATYLDKIANLLASKGHEITIITLSSENFSLEQNGIKIYGMKEKNHPYFLFLDLLSFFLLHKAMLWLAKSFQINQLLRKLHQRNKFDIVQYASTQALAFFAPSYIPWCIRNSGLLYQYNRAIGINRYWERQKEILQVMTLKSARFLYGPSSSTNELFLKDYRMHADLIRTPLPLEFGSENITISHEKAHPLNGQRFILFFGTLNELKGVQFIGPMLPYLFGYDPDIRFVFCGRDGQVGHDSASNYLKRCAGRFEGHLIFTGSLAKEELIQWIKSADLITLPSVVDNSPNTLIEALSHGKTVVCSDEASMAEMILHGHNGFTCDVTVSEIYFQTIRRALEMTEDERNNLKLSIEKSLVEFNPKSVIEHTLAFYNKVINDWN